MQKYITFLVLCLITSFTFADVYKWKDTSGTTHFSDTPHKGAERVKLRPTPTFDSESTLPTSEIIKTEEKRKPDQKYKKVSIVQPQEQQTLRDNNGVVTITAQTEPLLLPGDRIHFFLDGQPVGKPTRGLVQVLNNVPRGSHVISVKVYDDKSSLVGESAPINFFLHRAIARRVVR